MKFLLDTNACIAWLNRSNPKLISRLEKVQSDDLALCSIVQAELYYGAWKSQKQAENLERVSRFCEQFKSLPFDDLAANTYGNIRATLETRGQVIGSNDMLIAAIALVNQLTVVTHNTAEYSRVDGLLIEDWEA